MKIDPYVFSSPEKNNSRSGILRKFQIWHLKTLGTDFRTYRNFILDFRTYEKFPETQDFRTYEKFPGCLEFHGIPHKFGNPYPTVFKGQICNLRGIPDAPFCILGGQ